MMILQAQRKPSRWTDVCTDLCEKQGDEVMNTFTRHLYKKYRGLEGALEQYGTQEGSGGWKQQGEELGQMVHSQKLIVDPDI